MIVLVYNLLQAYASVFNFLQTYISKSSKSSSFNPLILSVRIALHCNFMRPANCKEMGIVTRVIGTINLQLLQGYASNFFLQFYASEN